MKTRTWKFLRFLQVKLTITWDNCWQDGKKQNYIFESTYRSLYCSDDNISRDYALPKAHKINCSFRIIISFLDSTLFNLGMFLHGFLDWLSKASKAVSNIENSFELVQKLRNIKIDHGFSLVSLDVISLFTNISTLFQIDGSMFAKIAIYRKMNFSKQCDWCWIRLILFLTINFINKHLERLWVHRFLRLWLI